MSTVTATELTAQWLVAQASVVANMHVANALQSDALKRRALDQINQLEAMRVRHAAYHPVMFHMEGWWCRLYEEGAPE